MEETAFDVAIQPITERLAKFYDMAWTEGYQVPRARAMERRLAAIAPSPENRARLDRGAARRNKVQERAAARARARILSLSPRLREL